MCAKFQHISLSQAPPLTSNQLSFHFKDDIYPNYDTPLLFATRNDIEYQWRQARFGLIAK